VSTIDQGTENANLRAQLAATEQLLAEHERISVEQAARLEAVVAKLEAEKRVLHATLNAIADGVIIADNTGAITHMNTIAEKAINVGDVDTSKERWSEAFQLFRADGVTRYALEDVPLARALRGEVITGEEVILRDPKTGETVSLVTASPIHDDAGGQYGVVVVFRDVTDRKRWEKEMERALVHEKHKNEEVLPRLEAAVQELSTPILEIWDDVLALPVIGIVDSRRSAEMMERLLDAIERTQCRFVIIDITGVDLVDSATADQFIKLVKAVELVGARCILTGTRGAVAQTLVALGADLGPLTTLRNLKHGLRECIRMMGLGDGRRAGAKAAAAAGLKS
jgi:rsbT co-antagonist protein RsbR